MFDFPRHNYAYIMFYFVENLFAHHEWAHVTYHTIYRLKITKIFPIFHHRSFHATRRDGKTFCQFLAELRK